MRDLSSMLVVIPCLDEAANLPRLLTQLRLAGDGALIVVADGGSTDGSRAIVEHAALDDRSVRLLDNPARIQSAGVNLAVERFGAGRDRLVRIDAHCGYPDDFIPTLLEAAQRSGAASVVVPMVTRGAGCFQIAAAAAQNSVLGTGGAAHRHVGEGRFVDHGHHALFDLAVFRAVGGYDDSFTHNEDAEFDHRLGAAGFRVWLEPAAALTYFPRDSIAGLYRQYVNYGQGRARTVAKHRLKLKPRQFLPLLIAPLLALAVIGALLQFWWPWFALLTLPAIGWATVCLVFGAAVGLRARSLCGAGAGIAAMVMHAAWSTGYWRMAIRIRRGTRFNRIVEPPS